jgi:hypothetical protein
VVAVEKGIVDQLTPSLEATVLPMFVDRTKKKNEMGGDKEKEYSYNISI